MKAAVYKAYGPPEVLRIEDVAKPSPKDNEVLIKVYATAVTTGDVRMRKADPFIARLFNGLFTPKKRILGMNFAGIIEGTGKDAQEFTVGDSVFGSTVFDFGAYAEYICMPQDGVIAKKPANMTYEEAAVVAFGAMTSLHFLRKGNIGRGQKVLVYGASGSLGVAAVQLARYYGAEVTGVCGTKHLELVRSLGADAVIDYTQEDFTKSAAMYDIIYDTVGKSPYAASVKKLNEHGVYLHAVMIPPIAPLKGLWTTITSGKKVIGGTFTERKEDLLFLKKLIEDGAFISVIDRTYPLDKIAEAHAYVEQGHKTGNVAITVYKEG